MLTSNTLNTSIINTLREVKNAVMNVVESYFSSDMQVMSSETKRIFSNPEDKKKYIDAIEKIQRGESKEESIELSTGKITLS